MARPSTDQVKATCPQLKHHSGQLLPELLLERVSCSGYGVPDAPNNARGSTVDTADDFGGHVTGAGADPAAEKMGWWTGGCEV